MNLQENISRIKEMMGINESSFLRRRVDINFLDDEFIDDLLNYASDVFIRELRNGDELVFDDFKKRIINGIIDTYHGELSNWGENKFPYDEIYNFVLDRYLPKIKSKYNQIINL
jgi:hypothetical protein